MRRYFLSRRGDSADEQSMARSTRTTGSAVRTSRRHSNQRPLGRFWMLAAALVACATLPTSTASADIFDLTIGVRGGAGAQFLNEPANKVFEVPNSAENFAPPFFEGLRAGHHYTLNWFAEARFYEYVGIEIGMGITRKFLFEEIDWEYTQRNDSGAVTGGPWKGKTEQDITFTGTTIPILIKGILPLDGARIWFGIGPEFWIGQWSRATSRELTRLDAGTPSVAPINQFRELRTKNVTDTYLAFALGFDVKAGNFNVPITLKFGYNLTAPANYSDRVEFYPGYPTNAGDYPNYARVRASDTFYGQILIGLSYDVL